MRAPILGPAPRPCESCPYRRDVPSGVWAASEYDKLPDYDRETCYQPIAVFLCHQHDGRVCAGWVGCHPADGLLSLRLAVADGRMSAGAYGAAVDYRSPVPLFRSGAAAAAHGRAEIPCPGGPARRVIAKVMRRQDGESR